MKLNSYRNTVTSCLIALAAACCTAAQAQSTQPVFPLPFASTIAGIPAGGSAVACTTTLPTAAGVVVPGDGCLASQATLNAPYGANVDSYGNVYWGDYNTYSLRVIYNGSTNLAAAIQAANPTQTIVPKIGYVYTLAGSRTAAIASTQGANGKAYYCNSAGTGQIGLSSNGDNCPATYAYIKPRSMAIDANGNVFFTTSSGGSPVRVFYVGGTTVASLITTLNPTVSSPQPGYIYTIIKSTASGYAGDGTLASSGSVDMYQERDVALDSKGNIYVSDGTTFTGTAYASNNNIRRVDAVTGIISTYAGSFGCAEPSTAGCSGAYNGDSELATAATLDAPYTIFFDQYDNLYITDDQAGRIRVVYNSGTVPGLITSTLVAGHIYTVAGGGTLTASNSPATSILITSVLVGGIDNAGNIWFVDGTSKLLWQISATTGTATIMGGGKTTVKGTACNGSTAPVTGPIATDSLGDGCAYSFNITASGKLAFDKFGNFYEAESTPAVLRKYSFDTLFPPTAVGSSSSQWLAYTPLLTNFTPTAEAFTLDGVASTQFSDAGSGTCPVGNVQPPLTICTINVKFTPTQAGGRHADLAVSSTLGTAVNYLLGGTGVASNTSVDPASVSTLGIKQTLAITGYNITNEVVTFNAANTLVAGQLVTLSGFPTSTFFNGVTVTVSSATATQFLAPITLANVNQTTESGTGTDFGGLTPTGVAVDAYGSAYIADSSANRLVKIAAGNAAVTFPIASGLSMPAQVAVDGLGNIYVADTGNNRIAKVSAGGTKLPFGPTGLSAPQGVAVDSQGNVYVADTANNRIVEIFATGGQVTLNITGLSSPTQLAVDSLGDLFVVDSGNKRVVELPINAEPTTLNFGATTVTPVAIAVDPAGDLYLVDSISQSVLEFAPGSVNGNQIYSGLVGPKGIAIDTNGSLYVADSSEPGALYIYRGIPTTSFPNTNLNTTNTASLNVTNTGNAALIFTAPLTTATGSTTAFSVTPTTSNGCSTTTAISSGGQCGFIASFTPTAKTTYSELVSFVSNAADIATSGAQLNGTGVLLVSTGTAIAITSPTTSNIYYSQQVNANITITTVSNAGSAPTGTVTYTVDGKKSTQTLPASGIVTITLTPAVGIHAISASYSGDVYYASSSNSYSFTVLKALTTTALTVVVGQQGTQPTLNFTAKVASTTAVGETGTVSFYNGTSSSGTLLATVAVNTSATASYNTLITAYPAYAFTACYNGDSNFAASACTTINPIADFTVVPTGGLTNSVPQGGVLTLTSNITPLYNYSGTITASCTGLPANANCRFAPTALPLSGTAPQTFNVYIYTNVQSPLASITMPARPGQSNAIYAARILAWPLAAGLILCIRRRKRLTRDMRLLSIILLTLIAGSGLSTLSGCSGSSTSTYTTPIGTSTVAVTFTDGVTTHTVNYIVNVIAPYSLP